LLLLSSAAWRTVYTSKQDYQVLITLTFLDVATFAWFADKFAVMWLCDNPFALG
jgi:hypothetical protein